MWSVMMLDRNIITLQTFVLAIIFMGLDEVSQPMMFWATYIFCRNTSWLPW
jgi:hypothetical protein